MRTHRTKYPLRRVIDYFRDDIGIDREQLECGHVVRVRGDIIGLTNATRRRCRKCAALSPLSPAGESASPSSQTSNHE